MEYESLSNIIVGSFWVILSLASLLLQLRIEVTQAMRNTENSSKRQFAHQPRLCCTLTSITARTRPDLSRAMGPTMALTASVPRTAWWKHRLSKATNRPGLASTTCCWPVPSRISCDSPPCNQMMTVWLFTADPGPLCHTSRWLRTSPRLIRAGKVTQWLSSLEIPRTPLAAWTTAPGHQHLGPFARCHRWPRLAAGTPEMRKDHCRSNCCTSAFSWEASRNSSMNDEIFHPSCLWQPGDMGSSCKPQKKMAQKGVIVLAVHDPFVAGITHILLRLRLVHVFFFCLTNLFCHVLLSCLVGLLGNSSG